MKAGKSSLTATLLPRLSTKLLRDAANVSSSVAMPRISSTSSISGTGFMKCMPMKCSGRSVTEASRVIEIEEVLVASSALFLRCGTKLGEDLALDRLVLGRRLDDEVAVAEGLQVGRVADALQGRLDVALP